MKKKKILLLGSTGSIGVNTLKVIDQNLDQFQIVGLSCETNTELLAKQIKEYRPKQVRVGLNQKKLLLEQLKQENEQLDIFEGDQGNALLTENLEYDLIVVAIVGAKGVMPVYLATKHGKHIALANKESIVLAGNLIMDTAKMSGSKIYPIDSEHNAIFQALQGNTKDKIKKIILCATGGPFLNTPFSQFDTITLEQALKHPKWEMGRKITIDSATMMNKALEIIEAYWLFQVHLEQIQVIIHPQALIHSLVEYLDHSMIAQISHPDMKIPISYCLSENQRIQSASKSLDLKQIGKMEFFDPDTEKFPTLLYAFKALKIGGGAPAFLNGANESLVEAFLTKKINFIEIFQLLSQAMDLFNSEEYKNKPYLQKIEKVEDAIQANNYGYEYSQNLIMNKQ